MESIPWGAKQRFKLFRMWAHLIVCACTLPYSVLASAYLALFEDLDMQAGLAVMVIFGLGILVGAFSIKEVPELYRDVKNFRAEYNLDYISRHF